MEIQIPKILQQTAESIDFCDTGIDEALNLSDTSSDILKGIIVGVVVGLIILKVIK